MITQDVSIPSTAKTWVYQAERTLTEKEIQLIQNEFELFLASWESHGKALKGYGKIEFDRFLVLVVDESLASASGCSIDKSVALIQSLENKLSISFLDKTKVAYLSKDSKIETVAFNQIKQAVENKEITSDTIIFNNTITTWEGFNTNWKQKAGESWVKRFL